MRCTLGSFKLIQIASPTRPRPNHIPALDGVRLLAVCLVILHHVTSGLHTSFFIHLIGIQRDNGIGPPLFFVLSGVLLSAVIIDARDAENRYRNFLYRRVLRIFPLYFAYLIAAVVLTWIKTGAPPVNIWVYAFFSQNIFVDAASNTGSVLPTFHLWTIAVQDQFYLVWPLLLWRCDSIRKMRNLCYTGIALSVLSRVILLHPALTTEHFSRILPAVAGAMCLGGLLALERRERSILTPILVKSFLPLALICFTWMWHGMQFNSVLGSLIGYPLIAVTCAAFIAIALQPTSWTARILGSKFFALGGKKYAFGMYIFHPCLLMLCLNDLPPHSKALRLALFVVSTVVVSGLSYRYYEGPFLHMPVGRNSPMRPAPAPAPARSPLYLSDSRQIFIKASYLLRL